MKKKDIKEDESIEKYTTDNIVININNSHLGLIDGI